MTAQGTISRNSSYTRDDTSLIIPLGAAERKSALRRYALIRADRSCYFKIAVVLWWSPEASGR